MMAIRLLDGLCLSLLLCYIQCVTSNTGNSVVSVPSTSDAVFQLQDTGRALYVRTLLGQRIKYVREGKRARDFTKWINERGGETTIFSMHGLDHRIDFSQQNYTHPEIALGMSKDPFAHDRMNLDLVVRPDSAMDRCKEVNLVEDRPPAYYQLCFRAINLCIHFAPVISTVGLAAVSKSFRENVWYRWLTSCIASSGAAWIKWGQWSSTRNDMFPEALCDQLAMLHSDAPEHSWSFSQQTVECSLGLKPGSLLQVFDSFDETPIASGSIAQIHKAVLKGQQIAAKIRHPRVAQLIDMDFRLMTAVARVFDWIPALKWLHIRESVEQFSHTMSAQSYLHVEGHHLEVLNHNFRSWNHVNFPRPFFASSALILESFEPGQIVTRLIEWWVLCVVSGSVHDGSSRSSYGPSLLLLV
jgi:hypothetical protein